jgi:flagellar basal body-associated protein FliL
MKKPVILAGVAAIVLLAVGYFVIMPMMQGKPAEALDHEEEDEPVAAAAAKKKKKSPEPGLIYPLPDRVLNLSGPAGTPRYARIELALEFDRPEAGGAHAKPKADGGHGAPAAKSNEPVIDPALEPVHARKVQIDDALVRIVGSKTMDEMTSAEGKDRFKQEVFDSVSEIVTQMDLLNVYIVRLVVQ